MKSSVVLGHALSEKLKMPTNTVGVSKNIKRKPRLLQIKLFDSEMSPMIG